MLKHAPMSTEIYKYILEKRLPFCSKNYLEFGSYNGGGITMLAEKFSNKLFYSIESFIQTPDTSIQNFIENVNDLKNIRLISIDSKIFNKFILNNTKSLFDIKDIDTILIDGDHSYEGCQLDINTSIEFLKGKDGFIYIHDAFGVSDVSRAINEFEDKYQKFIKYKDIDGDAVIFLTNFE